MHVHVITEVFGNNGHFGNPKLKFSIEKVQSNGFSGVTDEMSIPN